jgi:predicted Rossmann-fold nucleotide-binding protein
MAKSKGLKVCIAGGREITDETIVERAVKASGFEISEIVSGGAKGVDKLGEDYAKANKIKIKVFKAEWDNLDLPDAEIRERYNQWKKCNEKYAFNAGFLRNTVMADYAEALIAIPGEGGGTKDMITKAKDKGLKVFIFTEQKEESNQNWEYTL